MLKSQCSLPGKTVISNESISKNRFERVGQVRLVSIVHLWRPFTLLLSSILLYILKDGTQDSTNSTAVETLVSQGHIYLSTDSDLHLVTETEEDGM